jgi:hypothetical protein
MRHIATHRFWEKFDRLPPDIQRLARSRYELLKADARHPSVQFKKVGPYWSARINISYRAVAVESDMGMAWFWIGPHTEYEWLIRS